MRIALLSHSSYPIAQPYAGGLEMMVHLLLERLVGLGHDVTLYAHPDSDYHKLIPVDVYTVQCNSKERKILSEEPVLISDLAFAKAVNHMKNSNYDLVHSHVLNGYTLAALSMLKVPVIHTLHTPVISSMLKGFLCNHDFSSINFTTVSTSNASEWSDYIKKIEVIYNGVDTRVFKPVDPCGDHLLWYGRLCKEKAPHHAIKAALIAGEKLLMAGPIYDHEYYNEFIQPLLSNQNIIYLGHLAHEALINYIATARACLFTSLWDEPYGLVLAESLACGTPVIAYNSGAAGEILTPQCGLLVEKGAVQNLAEAIGNIETMDRTACRNRAMTYCSAAYMVERYENLYYSLTSKTQLVC